LSVAAPAQTKGFQTEHFVFSYIAFRMAGSETDGGHHGEESNFRRAALLHPLRGRILRRVCGGGEIGARELSAELDVAPGRIAYHLRLLARRRALKIVPRRRPAAPLYRLSPDADWVREMLDEVDAGGSEDG
jgi:DNA-binding transcriptional ArsR family regulator